MKTIAVVGAGISGLSAAALLSRRHRVHLFEQDARLGGHTNTLLVDGPNGPITLDTGSWCTTTARTQTWCGSLASSASLPATRTCRSRCRARDAGSSTAAAAPMASSRSGGTLCGPRTSRCSAKFEAVGLSRYDDYFAAADRLLAPDGVMFLQTITVDDQWFPTYHGTPDWIEKYIFPVGEVASVGEVLKSLARATSLSLYHAENCGTHYAHTLRSWRARFHHNPARVHALGFDDRFIRMWDLSLGSCEATFLERHTRLFQLVLLKNGARRVLFNEPWSEPASRPHVAGARESAA